MHRNQKAQWIESVLAKYEGSLLRYTLRMVGDLEKAREIVQESFLKLWQQEDKEIEEKIPQWLYVVCRNRAFDIRRKDGRMNPMTPEEEERISAQLNEGESVNNQDGHRQLLKHFFKLSEKHREVLRLKFQEGLSYKEISSVTGHSESYVGVLIHEGIKKLRSEFVTTTQKTAHAQGGSHEA